MITYTWCMGTWHITGPGGIDEWVLHHDNGDSEEEKTAGRKQPAVLTQSQENDLFEVVEINRDNRGFVTDFTCREKAKESS